MIPQLACFSFFSDLANIILEIVIAIGVVICVVIMAKFEGSRKILGYGLGVAIIVVGIFSSISLYTEVKAESYTNGSIDITNQFSQESLNYTTNSITFYPDYYADDDTVVYYFNTDLLPVDDFNGQDNNYTVELNDYILLNAEMEEGSVDATFSISFLGTSGELECEATLNISITFYDDKTNLYLTTSNSNEAQYLEHYFTNNSFSLEVLMLIE